MGFDGAHGVSISIHAPREGGDYHSSILLPPNKLFQSTPPARGATAGHPCLRMIPRFQSTPPARGATFSDITANSDMIISIHAPREGGDNDW